MAQVSGPIFDQRDYAGFWRRSIALFIDLVILALIYVLVADYWYEIVPEDWITLDAQVNVEFGMVLFVIAYVFLFRLTEGGTPGYRIVGIRYAWMFEGSPPFMARLYRAAITTFMIWGIFIIDHLWILIDERKQTWHDKVSGFYVVRRRAKPTGTQSVIQRVTNFMMLSFVVWEPKSTS